MTVTFFRTLIIFLVLWALMRLMGKRQIGEMQPFEFIVTLIIADLACFPMADVSIPLIYGIVAVLTLFILHQLLSILEQSGNFMKHVISGKPSIVINKQGVDLKELKKNNMGVDDLIESMRSMGYFSLDDLDYAIFESNGKLSALENPNKIPHPTGIPFSLIDEGKIIKNNLDILKIKESELISFLSDKNHNIKKIEIMTIDINDRIYLKSKGRKYEILDFQRGNL